MADAVTTSNEGVAAYPLYWPLGHPRSGRRREAEFKLEFGRARDETLRELRLLGAKNVVLSSNVPLRLDGIPYANTAEPPDPGIAVYFDRDVPAPTREKPWTKVTRPFVIACDTYSKVRWNMRAIGVTVESLRAIERHGSSQMLEQAFQGFLALPPKRDDARPWWEVLGVDANAMQDEILRAFRELAAIHHPDKGGDSQRMAEISAAYAASQKR